MTLYMIADRWGVPVRDVEHLTYREVVEQVVFYKVQKEAQDLQKQHQQTSRDVH